MAPDLEQSIVEALQAGKTIREIAAEHKGVRGASQTQIHRVAKKHGIVNGAKPKKASRAKRNGTAERNTEHGTEQGAEVPTHAPDEASDVEKRLAVNTRVATKAQVVMDAMMDRAKAIIKDPESGANLLKAAAQMMQAYSKSAGTSNSIIRLNAGLADSKTESDVRGHVEFTPEQVRQSASEAFGLDLGRTTVEPVPVAEEVRN